MSKPKRGKKGRIKNTIIVMTLLASMVLSGCNTLFGGSISGATKIDKMFADFGELMNLKLSSRGNVDIRLNFDGEYEGSKYASSYPDAFYFATDLSNSTEDITYFEMLNMIDNRYTVYVYQTHPYKDGKKRSDKVIVANQGADSSYVMYPEVIIDEKYEVSEDDLVTVFAIYDYTQCGVKGYTELGRWTCKDNQKDSYVYAKTAYSPNDQHIAYPSSGSDSDYGGSVFYARSYCICTKGLVINYQASDIAAVACGTKKVSALNPFTTDLNAAFEIYTRGKDTKNLDLAGKAYEIEVYNIGCSASDDGTLIYIDLTVSSTQNSQATSEDEKEIEKYNKDDYNGETDSEELSDEEAEKEAQAFQAKSKSYDFIACVIDKDVGTIQLECGPTKTGGYTVTWNNNNRTSTRTIYSIYAKTINMPYFGNYQYLVDSNDNAPFATMALYETNLVLHYDLNATRSGWYLDENGWKAKVNDMVRNGGYYTFYKSVYDSDPENYSNIAVYLDSYETEQAYYKMINDASKGLDFGLGKSYAPPTQGIVYNGVKPDKNAIAYTEFPMTITGDMVIPGDPQLAALVRITARESDVWFPLEIRNAHVHGVTFNNTDSSSNKGQFIYDDVMMGWSSRKIYNTPKSISSVNWFPESFSSIYAYNYSSSESDFKASYADVSYTARKKQITQGSKLGYYTFPKTLDSIDFLNTSEGGYALAVADGYVEAVDATSDFTNGKRFVIDTSKFAQQASEATEETLSLKAQNSDEAEAYWEKMANVVGDDDFKYTFSSDDGTTAGIVSTNAESGGKEYGITMILSSEGVYFYMNDGTLLENMVPYDSIDKMLSDTKRDNLKKYISDPILLDNWTSGANLSDLVLKNLRYRYKIAMEENNGQIKVTVSDTSKDNYGTLKTFTIKKASELDKLTGGKIKANYWNSIKAYLKEAISVDTRVYTQYKVKSSNSLDALGADNLDLQRGKFDGLHDGNWWVCSTALYGLGFQKMNNSSIYYIPMFQRVQHTLNTTSVYDEYNVFQNQTEEMKSEVVGLENGISCYGVYTNVNSKDKQKYPYVFLGYDNQGNVYTEMELCRAKVIPFGITTESFSQKSTVNGSIAECTFNPRGSDSVIYYLKDSFVNKNGQEIVYDPEADWEDELDKVTGKVVGAVYNGEGKGVADVTFRLEGASPQSAVTDTSGSAILRYIPEGKYELYANSQGVDFACFDIEVGEKGVIQSAECFEALDCTPQVEIIGNAVRIVISGFEGVDPEDAVTGRAYGYIYDGEGNGVPEIEARVEGPKALTAKTGDDGSFMLRKLPEGEYQLYISQYGIDFASFDLSVGPLGKILSCEQILVDSCTPEIQIRGNAVKIYLNGFTGVDADEEKITGRILGYVTNANKKGISNVTAKVSGGPTEGSYTTTSSGVFSIKRLREGEYKLSVTYKLKQVVDAEVSVGRYGKIKDAKITGYKECNPSISFEGNEVTVLVSGYTGASYPDDPDKPNPNPDPGPGPGGDPEDPGGDPESPGGNPDPRRPRRRSRRPGRRPRRPRRRS